MSSNLRVFDFYGFRLSLRTPAEMEMPALDCEFSFFEVAHTSTSKSDCQVELLNEKPDFDTFGDLKPSYYTPRNICYHLNQKKIINYHGNALLEQDPKGEFITLRCRDAQTAEAIIYSIILYQSGVHLEARGLHRVHALSFSYRSKAIMILLPMGGGKSTMLFELLSDPDFKLVSEDTPLLSADKKVFPFPVKLGLLPGKVPDDVPQSMIARMYHLEGQEKEIVDLAYLGERIEKEPLELAAIIIGERYLGSSSKLHPVSSWRAWRALFRDCVIGLGVYQGLEFAIMRGLKELFALVFTALIRSRVCAKLALNVPAYEFQMGCNISKNAQQLKSFLNTNF
jgi:hypothetical protein